VLARVVQQNLLKISKLNADAARKNPHRVVSPMASGLAGLPLIDAYLAGTPFRELLAHPLPFAIPRKAWQQHTAVFAPTGHGKTQTLQAIVANFLSAPDPPAIFILVNMGSMLKKIERLKIFAGELAGRLVILDPRDPPALNFFKLSGGSPAQQMELFFYLFKALDQSLTQRQATTAAFLVQLMQKIGGTLDTLRQVCEEKQPTYTAAIDELEPIARDFFWNQFYGKDPYVSQTKAQIAARLYTVGRNPIFNQMFSAPDNLFNAYDCIAEKKIVLVSTDRSYLGDDASALFGRFIIAQCMAAALAREALPERDRHLALLIVDEAKHFCDETTEKILSDARQMGLGRVLATQFAHQLPEGVRRAIYGNTAIKLIGPVEYADRVSLAREMKTTPEMIGDTRAYDNSHTEFAAHVRTDNLTPHAVKLTIPFGTLEQLPTMDESTWHAMRHRNRELVAAKVAAPPAPAPSPPPTLHKRQPHDFGQVERVHFPDLGLTLNALLDSGGKVSALLAAAVENVGNNKKPRVRVTIPAMQGSHVIEKNVVGTTRIDGMHGASKDCPVIRLIVTLADYTAEHDFAVSLEPLKGAQPVILGDPFFAAAPFVPRIVSNETRIARRPRNPQTWHSDRADEEL
jgi:hypothetical protein